MGKDNPLNKDEKQLDVKRVEPELESDKFSPEEQKKIVKFIIEDYQVGKDSMREWIEQKEKDLQQINTERPSIIEQLDKKGWMADRNLGIVPAVLDIYQATLLSTCYNPDTIHFLATEKNDIDNKDNLERFTKWGLGRDEANFFPEVDDFINHRVGLGFSVFKIFWEVKYEWVDKRIPQYSVFNKKRMTGYKIKTEERRFERGVIKNIDDLDDFVLPSYGKHLQDLKFILEVLHYTLGDLEDFSKRKIIKNYSQQFKNSLKSIVIAKQKSLLRRQEAEKLGVTDITDDELRSYPIDIHEWYGMYEKDNKRERYRFWIEPQTMTFLSGKPLRKINRSGKYPYAGGPLRRRPGFVRGHSLTSLIALPSNALNNNYNQTSDFQYISNMPFGFKNNDPGFMQPVNDIEPGKMFDVSGDPSKAVYFPNLTRSLAWSYQEKQFLLEVIERLTGAASYFLTSNTKSGTATRDTIVEEKGQTKFGLWVKRIQIDICEAINMWVQQYQDWAPPKLGERVLGADGKDLIRNLSIESLRGNYGPYMVPDITSGSKAHEKQIKLWALNELKANSLWFDPRINPRGNWMIDADAMKTMGYVDYERYLPPKPKEMTGLFKEAENEWHRFMQGEKFDPPEGETQDAVEHYQTHLKQKQEKYNELDEEYRPNFDEHLFQTYLNMQRFISGVQKERMAMEIANRSIQNVGNMGPTPGGPPGQAGPAGPVGPTGAGPTGPVPPIPSGVNGGQP